jgi:hypothetical protein
MEDMEGRWREEGGGRKRDGEKLGRGGGGREDGLRTYGKPSGGISCEHP